LQTPRHGIGGAPQGRQVVRLDQSQALRQGSIARPEDGLFKHRRPPMSEDKVNSFGSNTWFDGTTVEPRPALRSASPSGIQIRVRNQCSHLLSQASRAPATAGEFAAGSALPASRDRCEQLLIRSQRGPARRSPHGEPKGSPVQCPFFCQVQVDATTSAARRSPISHLMKHGVASVPASRLSERQLCQLWKKHNARRAGLAGVAAGSQSRLERQRRRRFEDPSEVNLTLSNGPRAATA